MRAKQMSEANEGGGNLCESDCGNAGGEFYCEQCGAICPHICGGGECANEGEAIARSYESGEQLAAAAYVASYATAANIMSYSAAALAAAINDSLAKIAAAHAMIFADDNGGECSQCEAKRRQLEYESGGDCELIGDCEQCGGEALAELRRAMAIDCAMAAANMTTAARAIAMRAKQMSGGDPGEARELCEIGERAIMAAKLAAQIADQFARNEGGEYWRIWQVMRRQLASIAANIAAMAASLAASEYTIPGSPPIYDREIYGESGE